MSNPWKMIGIGFVLVVIGVAVPWLMVIKVIPTSFLLGFASHAASVAGLFLGFIGATNYVSINRPPE